MYSLRSDRVIARKLKREQKKGEGGEGGERGNLFLPPPPPFSFPVFALVSTFSTSSLGAARYAGQKRSTHSQKALFR